MEFKPFKHRLRLGCEQNELFPKSYGAQGSNDATWWEKIKKKLPKLDRTIFDGADCCQSFEINLALEIHWKMVQGCIGSVKSSGKLNLDRNVYQTILPYGFWVKKSISAFENYVGAIFRGKRGGGGFGKSLEMQAAVTFCNFEPSKSILWS